MHDVLDDRELLGDEWVQSQEEGRDVLAFADRVRATRSAGTPTECAALMDALAAAPLRADWPYQEPTALADIVAVIGDAPPPTPLSAISDLEDRVLAAWLGRCVGCNLGKPVEGWTRDEIRTYLRAGQAYPLTDYIPKLDPLPEGYRVWSAELIPWGGGYTVLNGSWPDTTRGNITYMARDDDTDYTIVGLHILEHFGFDFTTQHIAETWLQRFPFLSIYTAERAAYRNLIHNVTIPQTALVRNPYREWIGAQIRADAFGYVNAGDPRAAALMAYRDAALSHVKNGIYGEMWAAALIAAAFAAPDARTALELARTQIPPHSRLAEALGDTLRWHDEGLDWEAARDALEERYYGRYSFVHTIQNSAVVAMALLWGAGDFTRTIAYAVQGGWDTDCNGATAGSIFGALHGTASLPAHWTEPLHDTIRSALVGFDPSRISDLAERTVRLTRKRFEAKQA